MCKYVYIYIYVCVCNLHTYLHMFLWYKQRQIERERERERGSVSDKQHPVYELQQQPDHKPTTANLFIKLGMHSENFRN